MRRAMSTQEKRAPATGFTDRAAHCDDGHETGLRIRPGGLDLLTRHLVHADGRQIRVDVIPSAAPDVVWADIAAGVRSDNGHRLIGTVFLRPAEHCRGRTQARPVIRPQKRFAKRGWRAAGDVDFGTAWEPSPLFSPLSWLEKGELGLHSRLHSLAWALSLCGIVQPAAMASVEWCDVPDVMSTRASRFAYQVVSELPSDVTVLVASELVAGEVVRALLDGSFILSSTQWRHIAIN